MTHKVVDVLEAALSDIRVVELGSAVAVPLSSSILGSLGADVIKVEVPSGGDDSRRWGRQVGGESPYFIQYNGDKRSIALDIKTPDGQKVLKKLIERADVLVENFRPGTMKKLGFPYPVLRRLNARLVYCSISGFGQTGPYRNLGGYDAIIQAMCGLMAVTGEADGPPLRVGTPITDIVAALYATLSILVALKVRERTGIGQAIDVSLFESGVSTIAQWITIVMLSGNHVDRFGNRYPLLAPYEVFKASDRPMVVAVGNDEMWARLCKLIGHEEIFDDPRFRTNGDRIRPANREVLTGILQAAFSKRSSTEWMAGFRRQGIPASRINTVEELWDDPQLKARSTFARVMHKRLGRLRIVSALPKFSETPPAVRRAAPILGEHSDEILEELGYTQRRIQELRRKMVVRIAPA